VLVKLLGKSKELIGVDLVDFDPGLQTKGLRLLKGDLSALEIESTSVDLIISRSVLEHVLDIEGVYQEFNRVLKPGGKVILLVPNFWDYTSLFSWLIPNRFHQFVVNVISKRPAEDTFPTYYKSNTKGAIESHARKAGFKVETLEYYGQYPYMLEFNNLLFRLGVYYDKFICKYRSLAFLRGWILCELRKPSPTV